MLTTLSIDKEIRDKANKKAKQDKMSLSAIARLLLLDYAEGRITIGTRIQERYSVSNVEVDDEIQQKMNQVNDLWNNLGK